MDSCPQLNAFFDEVMRITDSSSSIRSVVKDTVIGDSVLRAGMKVLIPYRQRHFNEHVSGQNNQELDPEKLLVKEGSVTRNPCNFQKQEIRHSSTSLLGPLIADFQPNKAEDHWSFGPHQSRIGPCLAVERPSFPIAGLIEYVANWKQVQQCHGGSRGAMTASGIRGTKSPYTSWIAL